MDSLGGCACKPAYFTLYRNDPGRKVVGDNGEGKIAGPTGNRREADRWLMKLQERIELGYTQPWRLKSILFPDWVDEYNEILAGRVKRNELAASTARGYAETLRMAVDAIRHVDRRN